MKRSQVRSTCSKSCASEIVRAAATLPESSVSVPPPRITEFATSIKQAMYFKDANPAVDAVVVYTDLRMPGMGEDFYRSAQRKGVLFTKGRVSRVRADGGG